MTAAATTTTSPPAAPGAAELPSRFSLITPGDWITLPLDPVDRDRRIAKLVERQVGRADAVAHLRRQTTLMLRDVASDAERRGAFFATTLSSVVEGLPLSASMLAFVSPLGLGPDGTPLADVDAMARALADPGHGDDGLGGSEVAAVELLVGPAVRVRRRAGTGMRGSDGREVVAESLIFHVPLADGAHQLVLAFSTPILPLADALVELFDAMASSVRWRHRDHEESER